MTIQAAGVEIHAASIAIPVAAFASRAVSFGFPAAAR
jgi:hypothetical protein